MKIVRVHTNGDDQEPLHINAEIENGLIGLRQGGDRDAVYIPLDELSDFISALTRLVPEENEA